VFRILGLIQDTGSLKGKLLYMLTIAIVVICASSLLITVVLWHISKEMLQNSMSEAMSYAAERLDSVFDITSGTATLMAEDPILLDYVKEPVSNIKSEFTRTGEITKVLANYSNNNPYISYIYLWPNGRYREEDGSVIRYSRYYPVASMIKEDSRRKLNEVAVEKKGNVEYCFLDEDSEGIFLTRVIHTIDDYAFVNHGVLAIRLNIQRLLKDLSKANNTSKPTILILANDEEVLFSSQELTEETCNKILGMDNEYRVTKIDRKNYFVMEREFKRLGLRYFYMVYYEKYDLLRSVYVLTSIAIILVAALLLFTSKNILDSITVHFDNLIKKMKIYSSGNFESIDVGYDYSKRNDEFGTVHRQFDKMADQIRTLINDNYVKQLLLKEAQFRQLEQQINPHFLYNTLETINWYSESAGEVKIAQLVRALGNTLRSTLERSDIVTINSELELVNNYMTIQKIRYENRLEYFVDADEDLLNCRIPKITIQPIVENAVKYAIEENTETCYIYISVKQCGEDICITVKNTGSEFEENIIEKIRERYVIPQGFGIGLRNIHDRLQLAYGQKYGITVSNEEDMAVVKVKLPKIDKESEDNYVQAYHNRR